MKKELYTVTRVRGDEKKELGSYLLKPGPVCPLWVGGLFVCVNRFCGFLLTCFANRVQYSLYDR